MWWVRDLEEERFPHCPFKSVLLPSKVTLSLQKCTFTFKTCPRIHMRNTVLISRSLSNSSLKSISFSTLRKRNSSSKVPVSLSIPYVVESTSRSEVLTTLTSSNFFLLRHLESFRYFFSSFKRPNCVSEWNRSWFHGDSHRRTTFIPWSWRSD
jgi:hypothetical protein